MAAKRHADDGGAIGAAARPAKATKRASASKDAPQTTGKAAKAAKPAKAARVVAGKPAEPAVEPADGKMQTAAAAGSHRKRRRRPAATDLSAEELARREHQRKRRAIALKVRAEGKEYKRQPVLKAAAAKAPAAVKRRHEDVDPGTRPDGPVQLIIVPIFWNKRVHEKEEVLEAAQRVCDLLTQSGLDAGCDTTVEMSPGQKFRHWEEAGVKVRVELGPKDAAAGQCILAICTTPGEMAAKSTMQVGAPLLKAVRRALGLGKVSADTAPMPKARARTAAAPPLQEGEVAAQPQQHSAAVVTAALKRQVAASGDDYADDFEELVAQDDTETKPARVKKSKQTKGKRPKTVTM